MFIRRLAVAHWRGLSFELADLSAGMNLIFGPNEAGKSRLVEALRFALFESSSGKSAHKKALATWGGSEKPRVTVEFEQAGTRWTLEKTFLGTGHNTRLRSAGETLEGAEAEERLADLLGVGAPGRTEMKAEDRGIWSLLWVDQGESRGAPAQNEVSQTRIHDHLTREIGEVAAGELGQRVLSLAEAQRNRFYTASRDAEKNTLTDPREKVAGLRRRLEEATARRDAVAQDADELDRQRAAERGLVERVARAEERREAVQAKHDKALELGQRLELYDAQVRGAESQRDQCALALQTALSVTARIEALTTRLAEAQTARDAADAERAAASAAVDEAARAAAEADGHQAAAESRVRALQRRREQTALREQWEALRTRLDAAAGVSEQILTHQKALATLPPITAKDLETLRRIREARDAARARLEGASASVELLAHRDLNVSGETLAKGNTRRLLVQDEQHVDVNGVLSLTVRAGGGELPRLRDAQSDAERALARQLEALSVTDQTEAEGIVEQRRVHDEALQRARRELQHHLPEGKDEAEAALRVLGARLDAAGGQPAEAVKPGELEQAEAALREAAVRRDEQRTRRDVASERLATARETFARRRADLESLQHQLDEARTQRESQPDTDALKASLEAAERTWRERVAGRDTLEQQFDALGGEDIELDLEQATRARDQLDAELKQVRDACVRLVARLETAGDDGRHEQVQELAGELARAEAELAAVERQAAAARRLYEVLLEEYESARERLAQPVIARIRPYLQSLFPGTEVWLDENLNLLGLRGRDTDQQFEALSGGAREQLALLVRIGLAEVLGIEEPKPLVLDDVLVNTDAERIQRVQRLLYQASRHMQILLFTCHGPLFDGLGADARIELPGTGRAGQTPADEVVSAG